MNQTTTICIDLAKTVYQVALFNKHGTLKLNKAMNESQMTRFVAQHPEALICMEACGSSHHWGRRFIQEGHQVRLVPAHIVARYRSGNKNDANDALAIYSAAQAPKTYFVTVRTLEQQDLACQHKLRQGYVKQRTQLANRIRGFALEYGVGFPKGIGQVRRIVPEVLEDAENGLTCAVRAILRNLLDQLLTLDGLIDQVTQTLVAQAKQLNACQALTKIPGLGWLGASALYVRLGNGSAYRRGRDASASLGLVPAHTGSGGKNQNLGISKRGDRYLRTLLIHGSRSVVNNIRDKQDGLSCWIRQQLQSHHKNNTTVALANKLVRMAWAVLSSGHPYRPPVAQ